MVISHRIFKFTENFQDFIALSYMKYYLEITELISFELQL